MMSATDELQQQHAAGYTGQGQRTVGFGGTQQRKFNNLTGFRKERALLLTLLITSIVEFVAALEFCDSEVCLPKAAWAVSAGVVSAAISVLMLYLMFFEPNVYEALASRASLLLFAWWIPAATVTTFYEPFNLGLASLITDALGSAYNGYFGAWASLFAALIYCNDRLGDFDSWSLLMHNQQPMRTPAHSQAGSAMHPSPSHYPVPATTVGQSMPINNLPNSSPSYVPQPNNFVPQP